MLRGGWVVGQIESRLSASLYGRQCTHARQSGVVSSRCALGKGEEEK